jgi:hypothetical protein
MFKIDKDIPVPSSKRLAKRKIKKMPVYKILYDLLKPGDSTLVPYINSSTLKSTACLIRNHSIKERSNRKYRFKHIDGNNFRIWRVL